MSSHMPTASVGIPIRRSRSSGFQDACHAALRSMVADDARAASGWLALAIPLGCLPRLRWSGQLRTQGRPSCQTMPTPRQSRPRSPDESGPRWSPATLMASGICSIPVPARVRRRGPATPTAPTATRSSPGGPAREPPVHGRWSLRCPPAPEHFWRGWTSPARRLPARRAERRRRSRPGNSAHPRVPEAVS